MNSLGSIPLRNDLAFIADCINQRSEVLDCIALQNAKPISLLPNWRGSLAAFRLQ